MTPRLKDAIRRAARASAFAGVFAALTYFGPLEGPAKAIAMLVNGIAWGLLAFLIVLVYRLARPARPTPPTRA